MSQKAGAKSLARVSPFDDSGNVGHDERSVVAVFDDAQVGFERRKGVVRYFRLGGR